MDVRSHAGGVWLISSLLLWRTVHLFMSVSQSPRNPAPQRSLKEHEQRAYSVSREWRGEQKFVCMCVSESTFNLKCRESPCTPSVEWSLCEALFLFICICVCVCLSVMCMQGEYPPDIMPLFSAKLQAQRACFMAGSLEAYTSKMRLGG